MSGYNDEFEVAKKARPNIDEDGLHADREAQDESALATSKEQLQERWLTEHPDKTAEDFERLAWPGLREKLREEGR